VRRIGAIVALDEHDRQAQAWLSGFTQGLAQLGWTEGRNLRMDIRWGAGSVDRIGSLAKELVDLKPEVILAHTTPVTAALQQETPTIPIVFVNVADPIGAGFVASLPRPGGNITGFINIEAAMGGKLLQLLKEIAPDVKRAAILFNPKAAAGGGSYFLPSFEAAARSLRLEPIAAPVNSEAEIETIIGSLGQGLGGGLVVPGDIFTVVHRASIILLAARSNVPAVYFQSIFASEDGLLSYGADQLDLFRRSASYVDRSLGGAKPAELPVQVPTKFELVINLKTAKALGLAVPQSILLRADEVIE